ncbi:hypothetical protein B0T21DRAFT_414510 [Apiosordaria backusii]|uniref:Uncharacterized protein n=1 Tax=Apiosordaria backusii TaxID=314023 RepID=A0AA40ASP7_9PEZI|nr:hypothetical protein B0T21DRAFT_414510 [Apiosordaria backusii]
MSAVGVLGASALQDTPEKEEAMAASIFEKQVAGASRIIIVHAELTSVKQFLNSIELCVKDEIGSTQTATNFSVSNLKYFRELLDSHAQNLEEVLLFLRNRDSSRWPSIQADHQLADLIRSKNNTTARDFEYLMPRARKLEAQCLEGVSIITNGVMLQESRKAIDTGEQTKTVTLLAFFYLPLALATSFFGMNFVELGQGTLTIWIGICTGIALVIL